MSGLKAVDVDLESPSFGPAWSAVDSHDIVQGMGTDEDFGVDPMDLDGVTHISGDVPEPDGCGWMFSPTGRHGTYMNEGSEALEDMARVAVGVYR